MARSAVILLENNRIALIERVREGRTYYVFPGGKIEAGETPEQAAIREAHEELGVAVVLDRLLAIVRFGQSEQYYYLAHMQGGQFGTGDGEEYASAPESEAGTYRPVMVAVEDIAQYDVRPAALASMLASQDLATLTAPVTIEETPRLL